MKHSVKKQLAQAFEAPPPLHREDFLRKLDYPGISTAEFIFIQIGYIRKWVWGVSALVFMVSLAGSVILSVNMLWAISSFTPLLALTILAENGRSESCEMAELEMATRFSLRSLLFARMGILGMENLALLCLLIPLGLQNNRFSPIQAGVYITTPYLLTSFSGLWIVRRFRERESICFCAIIAACVSFSVFFSHRVIPQIYQGNCLVWWIMGMLLLCAGTIRQYFKNCNAEASASERRIT